MNLSKQPSPSNSIVLTGAQISRNALIIDKGATDDQLGQIGLTLAGMEGSRCWWIGDYGACLTSRKGEHYTAGRAEALGIEPQSFRIYVSVSRFFDPVLRVYDSLSFAHYRASMEAGELALSQNWLEMAQKECWSVSQLRKAINMSKATQRNDGSEAEANDFEFMDKADKWATTKRKELGSIEPETARNLLEVRWVGVIQFIEELREIAKG